MSRFLSSPQSGLSVESTAAESIDCGEDVISGLGPAEGLGFGIVCVDVGLDCRFELDGRTIVTPAHLTVGEQAEI